MDLEMLAIVAVIVIPGYFIVSYFTKVLYSQSSKMDESTEEHRRNQPYESGTDKEDRGSNDIDDLKKIKFHKRAKKKIVKLNKKSDNPVIIKYRKQAKKQEIHIENINKSDKLTP